MEAHIDLHSDSIWDTLTRPAYGLATSGGPGGFNLGGYANSHISQKTDIESQIPVPGLQFFNYESHKWLNNSALGYSAIGTAVNGGMVHVPSWGSAGLLVILGGQTADSLSTFNDGQYYTPLSNISLFDPVTQTWYHQEATGSVPDERDRFCVAGVRGGDNSTFG